VSDLKFGKPPKKEKKTKRPIRQKSLREGKSSELKKILSTLPFSAPQAEEKKKDFSSIKRTPIKNKVLDNTNEYPKTRKPINQISKKKSRPVDQHLETLKASLPLSAEKRLVDRSAMDECKSLPCVITGFKNPKDPEHFSLIHDFKKVDPCHVDTRGSGSPDIWWNMIPMQRRFHQEQGTIGIKAMADKYPRYAEALRERGWYWNDMGKLCNDRYEELTKKIS
jgi:hypothetical protein